MLQVCLLLSDSLILFSQLLPEGFKGILILVLLLLMIHRVLFIYHLLLLIPSVILVTRGLFHDELRVTLIEEVLPVDKLLVVWALRDVEGSLL